MRQTKTLLSTSVVPSPTGPCSLSSLTAASWPFPTLSLRIFLWLLGPIPRRFFWCIHSFLPRRHRPLPAREWLGTQRSQHCNFCTEGHFGAAVILLCSGLQICSPPWLHLPQNSFRTPGQPWLLLPRISRFVTSPSSGYASRPNRAIDGRGTEGLSPSKIRGLAGRS